MNKKESDALVQMFRTLGFKCEDPKSASDILFSFQGQRGQRPLVTPSDVDRATNMMVNAIFEESKQHTELRKASRLGICAECEDGNLTVFSWNIKILNEGGSLSTVSLPTKLCKKCGTFYAPFKSFDEFLQTLLSAAGGQKLTKKEIK